MRRNEVVRLSELVAELWGECPPPSALPTVQTYVYKLRKVLREDEAGAAGGALLTRPYGYVLATDEDNVDAFRFGNLAVAGRAAHERGEFDRATRLLTDALALWRGPALVDVSAGDLLSTRITALEGARLEALELRISADLELGRHQALVSELTALAASHPMHEGFHGQLMLALHRCRRRFEALQVYQRLRHTLQAELGVQPSERLRDLHRALLGWDSSLKLAPPAASAPPAEPEYRPAPPPSVLAPPRLPPEPTHFSGREELVGKLTSALAVSAPRGAVRLVSVTGMPGVGKTAVALRAAHRVAPHFPDGQFFVDLLGSTPYPVPIDDALAEILRACGVSDDRLPGSTEERSALFRTLSSRRRILLVLDDAVSAADVSPLLPSAASCAVVVTTRAHSRPGAERLHVPPFGVDEGVELLGRMVGRDRVFREAHAARSIVVSCGGLPLALRAVGRGLAVTADRPLAQVAERLADTGTQLDELLRGDCDVPSHYDGTYRRLREWERSAFRLLSLVRHGEFGVSDVAGLLGCGAGRARLLLDGLVEHHLLWVEWRDGLSDLRYGFHRLVRAYAQQRLEHALGVGGDPGVTQTPVPMRDPANVRAA